MVMLTEDNDLAINHNYTLYDRSTNRPHDCCPTKHFILAEADCLNLDFSDLFF